MSLSPASLLAVLALHGAVLLALWPGERRAAPPVRNTLAVQLLPAPLAGPGRAMPAWQAAPPLLPVLPVLPVPRPAQVALPDWAASHEAATTSPEQPVAAPDLLAALPPVTAPGSSTVATAALSTLTVSAAPPARHDAEPAFQSARRAACAAAPHPLALRERGIEGVVRLRVWVDALGRADPVLVSTSSGWRLFDEAALAQARRCPFLPARRGEQPVGSWVEFSVRFSLEGSSNG